MPFADPEKKKQADKKYAENNRERISKTQHAWYIKNQERLKATQRARRAANPEEFRRRDVEYKKAHPEAKKLWDEKNKEHVLEYRRERYRLNREKQKAQWAAWRKANPERLLATQRAYRAKHPESVRRENQRRRALKRGASLGDLKAIQHWEADWKSKTHQVCYWCRKLTRVRNCHSDHVVALDLHGAHALENMCVSCDKCNLRKNKSSLEDWNKKLIEPVLF